MIYSLLVGKNTVAANKLSNLLSRAESHDANTELLLSVQGTIAKRQKNYTLKDAQQFASAHPRSISAQFHLLEQHGLLGNWHAIETLALGLLKNPDFQPYSPAVSSYLVWLYGKTGRDAAALELLEKNTGSGDSTVEERAQIAEFKVKLGKFAEARADFEQLFGSDGLQDNKLNAYYLLALSKTEPSKAAALIQRLDASLVHSPLDADTLSKLEDLPNSRSRPSDPLSDGRPKQKRKRVRPVPKDFSPSRVPDPNRWLPKAQREVLKAKIRNEKEISGMGFQGTVLAGGGIGSTGSAKIAGLKPQLASGAVSLSKQNILDGCESDPPLPPVAKPSASAAAPRKKKGRK
ncbi:hypothetical protein HDU91_000287 [Kappamyces sp. JEL0680]|nr:hypothetical protein HDU91_000287 [Kappamyces sp. JEL0680]